MSIGFRKSLFGFNTDDVINYVKKLHNSFSSKESELKSQISELEKRIVFISQEQERLNAEKEQLNLRLREYAEKAAETERLSENIGKLYLVAQTNAKSIMDNAKANSDLADSEVVRNVSAIDETHLKLNELKQSINATADSFNKELNSLIESLEETKAKITEGAIKNADSVEEFAQLLEAVSK